MSAKNQEIYSDQISETQPKQEVSQPIDYDGTKPAVMLISPDGEHSLQNTGQIAVRAGKTLDGLQLSDHTQLPGENLQTAFLLHVPEKSTEDADRDRVPQFSIQVDARTGKLTIPVVDNVQIVLHDKANGIDSKVLSPSDEKGMIRLLSADEMSREKIENIYLSIEDGDGLTISSQAGEQVRTIGIVFRRSGDTLTANLTQKVERLAESESVEFATQSWLAAMEADHASLENFMDDQEIETIGSISFSPNRVGSDIDSIVRLLRMSDRHDHDSYHRLLVGTLSALKNISLPIGAGDDVTDEQRVRLFKYWRDGGVDLPLIELACQEKIDSANALELVDDYLWYQKLFSNYKESVQWSEELKKRQAELLTIANILGLEIFNAGSNTLGSDLISMALILRIGISEQLTQAQGKE